MKRSLIAIALLLAAGAVASPAAAQRAAGISITPYVGYGFFGDLPETDLELEGGVAFGGRAAYQVSEQFALFGNWQRSLTQTNFQDSEEEGDDTNVDHWSLGVEFSFVPRGGAEGMLPLLFEAGLGQVRYEGDSDIAANLGIASAIRLNPNFGIRYGVNDYISNYNGDGIVNQIFAHVGAEIRF